jgi:hypothetical protein
MHPAFPFLGESVWKWFWCRTATTKLVDQLKESVTPGRYSSFQDSGLARETWAGLQSLFAPLSRSSLPECAWWPRSGVPLTHADNDTGNGGWKQLSLAGLL